MIIQKKPELHLTYCLNVHPGETWAENLDAIRQKAMTVKLRVAHGAPFGLGLRLGHQAACELASPPQATVFREFLADNQLYVFTINGFPYGRFHGQGVKEKVYQPDWRSTERRDYTIRLANILAGLLPEKTTGSISAVPCSFKPWITKKEDVDRMVEMLMDCVIHLADLHKKTGKEIHLGLEPEPGCYLETTDDFLAFFKKHILPGGRNFVTSRLKCSAVHGEKIIRRHLGVCFDTCHVALQFEDLNGAIKRYRKEGIRISKIQLSAALEAESNPQGWRALQPFCEPVYLHQVVSKTENRKSKNKRSWNDLPKALADLPSLPACKRLRVHFHVPLFWETARHLGSTASCLTPEFFQQLKESVTQHLEIETYTFDVLPDKLRSGDVVDSIVREYEWVLSRI